ncbi:MAG: esterase-like activity of phytase family protein [Deefgea sp.]
MSKQKSLMLAAMVAVPLLLSACGGSDPIITPEPIAPQAPQLSGRAVLPAATFADGPLSGQYLGGSATNGQTVPFAKQPVQGFSAILKNADGSFLAMSDNGYGSLENSADFNLRVYTIRPNFKTASSGDGSIKVEKFIELKDPNKLIPFAITNQFSKDRILTGADFDIESMQRAPDGSLWFGDEFGPFLIHTDASGVLLEAPIKLMDTENAGQELRSPQNPYAEEGSAVRIMNAVRAHAQQFGGKRTPVFSPYHVMMKYDVNGVKSTADAHYARGKNLQTGLTPATSEIFDVASLKSAGYQVVTWTVNDKARMTELLKAGVNGIITDRPDLLYTAVKEFDANKDGVAGDYLTKDGLIDQTKFDAQGHRGARNLRPENTLPAMEAALDNLMTTLETDSGISKDGISVLKHDPYIETQKCRRTDGKPYDNINQEVLMKDLTLAEMQSQYICDKLFRGADQKNDIALSPVSAALATSKGYTSPYVLPKTQDVFDLVTAYIDYYSVGAGKAHADAAKRVANAKTVRFNIETKINPRSDKDNHGKVYKDRTVGFEQMTDTLAGVIVANKMEARADIQSFDFRTLLRVQEKFPAIRTVYLFGDFPIYPTADSDDGTNMQDENGKNTPWMAGLYWPYRSTAMSNPFRVKRSGGFEGMALSSDGTKLYPLLETPLVGHDDKTLIISEFDLATRKYTGKTFKYKLDAKGSNIGDFIMYNAEEGIIIERDNSQGDLNGFKKLFKVKLGKVGDFVEKTELVNLMDIKDPSGISGKSSNGDIGLGSVFAMPFVTIEDVVVIDENTLGVLNDNNYPFSIGRHMGSKQPDDNEFMLIKLPTPLKLSK